MEKKELLSSIATRGSGEIYLGVVGAVITGKSTFIKKLLENLVVPNIHDEYERNLVFYLIVWMKYHKVHKEKQL